MAVDHIAAIESEAGEEWYLDLAEVGRRTIRREPIGVALTLRGTAEALLLLLWGASTLTAPTSRPTATAGCWRGGPSWSHPRRRRA